MRRGLLALALLVSCERVDPEVAAQRDALARWEAGVASLDAGDAVAARAAFQEARALQPRSTLLVAWEAEAAAAAGDLDGAIALLEGAVAASPGLASARYNLAAYLARQGDVKRAAAELKRALDDGAAQPRDVLDDPDFASYLSDDAFDFLPVEPLAVVVEVSEPLVFWGSDLRLRLRIRGADGPFVSVTPERAVGPLRLLTVVEDVVPSTDGPIHDITWTLRAVGEGPVEIGPLHVWAGRHRALVDGVVAEAKAPPERADPGPLPPLRLSTPRELAARAEVPSARVIEHGLTVLSAPGDRVDVAAPEGSLEGMIRYELRERSVPTWVLRLYPDAAAATRVTITRAGEVVLDAAPTP